MSDSTAPTLTPQQLFRKKAAGEPIVPDEQEKPNRHIVSVKLENSVGALNRVLNLFSARGFNLESVTVGMSDEPSVSRLTLVTTGNDRIIGQVMRQLTNLVDTLEVDDLTGEPYVERELALVTVGYTVETRPEIMDTIEIFRGKVVNITEDTVTIELTGPNAKVNAFIGLIRKHGIVEVARSGRVAMRRALPYEQPDE
ncbi:MAG: acetolactate synthase small subunit [Bacteroidetes bacterium]|nr:acetolactate synthase small subunit [Bacteroidota bacterium]